MNSIIELNSSNFENEVLRSNEPVLVDFWAEWCGPCKMLAPVLDELAREHAGRLKVAKLNIDHEPALAAKYRVQSIPTLLYFSGGQVRQQTVGVVSKKTILDAVNKLSVPA